MKTVKLEGKKSIKSSKTIQVQYQGARLKIVESRKWRSPMVRVQKGDKVSLHYTVRSVDGTVLESTKQKEPVTFTQGKGKVLEAVDNAILGMNLGQKKTLFVPEEQGHGPYKPEMVAQIDYAEFIQRDIKPEVGLQLQAQQPNGNPLNVTVVEVSDSKVTLDANHPLAGHDLTYDLELVGIH